MKTKRIGKIVTISGAILLVFGFLCCCSGIQFPFIFPRSFLDFHLKEDFGCSLPGSAAIEKSYWVGSRDPEEVFKIQTAPADMVPFIERLRAGGGTRNHKEQSEENVGRFGPLYKTPSWWNNPPLIDPIAIEFMITSKDGTQSHYRLLYSPTTGKLYLVWGGF